MKILQKASIEDVVELRREFHRVPYCRTDGWFSFEVDPTTHDLLSEDQRESFDHCLAQVEIGMLSDSGEVEHRYRAKMPATGECQRCGRVVMLDGFTNSCECGLDYNMSGQLLANREQWGEETGETYAEITAGGHVDGW